MAPRLNREQVREILANLKEETPKQLCWSCDCLQGFLTALELEADEDVSDLIESLKITRSEMHGCLGCNPCPPGKAYADFLRERSEE